MDTKASVGMTADEFLSWNAEDWRHWELVDSRPRVVDLKVLMHGLLLAEIAAAVGDHLRACGMKSLTYMRIGVTPRIRSSDNLRVADLVVASSRQAPAQQAVTDPKLIVEVLSPGEEAATWSNLWAYASIPSLEEFAVLYTAGVCAEVWRRGVDGAWPNGPETVESGDLVLDSIQLRTDLKALYRGTAFNPDKD